MTNKHSEEDAPSSKKGFLYKILWVVTCIHLLGVVGYWGALTFFSADSKYISALAYMPTFPLFFSSLFLVALSAFSRSRWCGSLNAVALLLVCFGVMGFQLGQFRKVKKPPKVPKLRLMTLNIFRGMGGSKNVVQAIRAHNPDIFALQEAYGFGRRQDPPLAIVREMPDYYFARKGYLLLGSRFPILDWKARDLGVSGRRRHALEVRIMWRGMKLTIFNAHLLTLVRGKDMKDWATFTGTIKRLFRLRNVQLGRLMKWVKKSQGPTFLMGDFNTPPRGHFYQKMTEDFTDTFAEVGWGFGHSFTYRKVPLLRIDYILSSKHFRPIRAFVPKVMVSDHRPVVTDLFPKDWK